MKVKRTLLWVWLSAILTIVSFPVLVLWSDLYESDDMADMAYFGLISLVIFCFGILSVALLISVRNRLSPKQKKPFMILAGLSGMILLIILFSPLDEYVSLACYDAIFSGLVLIFVLSGIFCLTCYAYLFDKIFPWLFAGIILGLVLNRLGVDAGGFIVGFCFFLAFYGFFFLAITYSKKSKDDRTFRRIISAFCYINCVIFFLLFFKFSSEQPAFTRTLDVIGVILFLLASIALFISLPFSNFIEWLKTQRQIFYKVILLPFLFFLIVFSLTFLLPDSTYRKIFFIEYSKKEKVHFGMEDYESEID